MAYQHAYKKINQRRKQKSRIKGSKKLEKVLLSERLAASQQPTTKTTVSKTPSVVVDIATTLPKVTQLAKTLRKNIANMQNEITLF